MEGTGAARLDLSSKLVPGRECGSCNVCCVALTIDEPALRKPQGLRCRNAAQDGGCRIYPTRPPTCREFFCGWRLLRWVREGLRPDRSGVLFALRFIATPEQSRRQLGVVLTLLTPRAIKAEGLAETVAAAVNADLPTFMSVPGPPGYTSSLARIDEALRPAVIVRDKPAVLEVLRSARNQGSKGHRERIVMAPEAPEPPLTA